MVLLYGPAGWQFLISEVPLYGIAHRRVVEIQNWATS